MSCLIQSASNGIFDFTAKAGRACTLFVTNSSETAVIEAAQLNGLSMAVTALAAGAMPDGQLTVTFAQGANTLLLTIDGAAIGDQVELMEDCGGGSQILDSFTFDGDPVAIYRVYAT